MTSLRRNTAIFDSKVFKITFPLIRAAIWAARDCRIGRRFAADQFRAGLEGRIDFALLLRVPFLICAASGRSPR
jgi:hypothetical protein